MRIERRQSKKVEGKKRRLKGVVILEFQALGSVVSPIQSTGGEKRVGQEKKEKEEKGGEREREIV